MPASRSEPRRLKLAGGRRAAAEAGRNRIALCLALFAIGYGALLARLAMVSLIAAGDDPRIAEQAFNGTTLRAEIVDRNGVPLAVNLPAFALHLDGRDVWDAGETARLVADVVDGVDAVDLAQRLRDRKYVVIRSLLTPQERQTLLARGVTGATFHPERKRIYPQGRIAAHVAGYVDADGRGVMGLERRLDDAGAPGGELAAAMDIRVQSVLHELLSAAKAKFDATAAWGAVMDVGAGEVLALVSLPDFDPNFYAAADPAARRNRVTLDVYEMGSAFKAFTLAMALDSGAATPASLYDARRPIRVGGHRIRDFHGKNRILSAAEVFIYSSNIGAARMALEAGAPAQHAFLREFGMLDRLESELVEHGRPLAPERWREAETATISYGHGLAVTPLHVLAGMAALVNGGAFIQPTFLEARGGRPTPRSQVISPETSALMRGLLRLAVVEGTGGAADVPGYWVGGKTATADKAAAGGYDRDRRLSSFVGVFPGHAPKYAVLVSLDEPKGIKETHGYATAGWTAAPLAGEVIARIGPILGVRPYDAEIAASAPVQADRDPGGDAFDGAGPRPAAAQAEASL